MDSNGFRQSFFDGILILTVRPLNAPTQPYIEGWFPFLVRTCLPTPSNHVVSTEIQSCPLLMTARKKKVMVLFTMDLQTIECPNDSSLWTTSCSHKTNPHISLHCERVMWASASAFYVFLCEFWLAEWVELLIQPLCCIFAHAEDSNPLLISERRHSINIHGMEVCKFYASDSFIFLTLL